MKKELTIVIDSYTDSRELQPDDAELLELARKSTADAYAPYSRFRVAAAVRLANGEVLSGTNQENASYPAGICAERVVLSAASAVHPGVTISALAVSCFHDGGVHSKPVSPCGICRQTLIEYELRGGKPIRIILAGFAGEVLILHSASDLMPLAFTSAELEKQ